MATHYRIEQCKVGMLKTAGGIPQQAVFGTAGADALNALELAMDSIEINEDVKKEENDTALTGIATDDIANHETHNYGNSPQFEINTPNGVVKQEIDVMLYAHMQSVTEGATTPYSKTFVFPTTQPDFSASAGYFGTFVFRAPDASNSIKIRDCIGCAKLAFSIDPGDWLKANQSWQGRGAVAATSNPTGTWARSGRSGRYHYNNLTMLMDFGAGDQTVVKLGAISWETNTPVGFIDGASGDFANFAIGPYKGTFNARINYDANGKSAETNHRAGTPVKVTLRWGNATAGTVDGDLQFKFQVELIEVKRVAGDNGIFAVDLSGAICGDQATAYAMYQVIMANAIDRAW
jgi:hypothetical protein